MMKILCDFCKRAEATFFCSADDAAFCSPCDRRVHSANKVAFRHSRQPLLQPSNTSTSHTPPLCDICKEKRGYVFCQEDRAVLCRDCDTPIHSANHLTAKHNRFLLTGARLAASSSAIDVEEIDAASDANSCGAAFRNRPEFVAVENKIARSSNSSGNRTASSATSSFSDYLLQTLPGWRVDDFLFDDDASVPAASDGYYQTGEVMPFGVPMTDAGVGHGGAGQDHAAFGEQYQPELWAWTRQ